MQSVLSFFFIIIYFFQLYTAEPKIKLLNVIFRHGDRTPTTNSMFPADPYYHFDFYPYGLGALTNCGKSRIYKFGELLRDRYKNFLGDVYLPDLIRARSSDYDRTKMSLQLVLAALFPPTSIQKWHNTLDWQPIPFTYVGKQDDDILATIYQPKFLSERRRVEMTENIRERLADFQEFMLELSNLTGKSIENSLAIKSVYDTLVAESYMNLTLPKWASDMSFNNKLYDGVMLDYDIISYDNCITNALAGKLILKIVTDMSEKKNNTKENKVKLFLYSGHDANVVGVLRSLNVFRLHVPQYASAVIIELLEENDEYYIKVLYYRGIPAVLNELQIPGCSTLCPFEKFVLIIKNILINS